MSHYIKSMIDDLLQKFDKILSSEGIASRLRALIEEAERLDPRDFAPAHRFEFVNLRRTLKTYISISDDDWSVIGKLRLGPFPPRGTSGFMLALLRRVELADAHGMWAEHPNDGGCTAMARGLVSDTQSLLSR